MALNIPNDENKPLVLETQKALQDWEEAILVAAQKGAAFMAIAGKNQPKMIVPKGMHGYTSAAYEAAATKDNIPIPVDQFGVPMGWYTEKETIGLHPFHRHEIMQYIGEAMGALGNASAAIVKVHYESSRNMYEHRIITGGGGK